MKIVYCTEDDSDEAILNTFVERILDRKIERIARSFRFQRGGWNTALKLAPSIAHDVYRTEANGALFAVDNDEADPVHSPAHQPESSEDCRHCRLVLASNAKQILSWPRPELPPLKFWFVVPVRTIESWLLLSTSQQFPGNPELFGKTRHERLELKRRVWGTDRPDQQLMIRMGSKLVRDANIKELRGRSASFDAFCADLTFG